MSLKLVTTYSGASKYVSSPSITTNMSKANSPGGYPTFPKHRCPVNGKDESITILELMMRVGSVGLPLEKVTKYFRIKI